MKTLHLGPEELLVAAKIGIEADAAAPTVAGAIDAAERNVRAAEPMAQQVYVEPDVYPRRPRAGRAPRRTERPQPLPGADGRSGLRCSGTVGPDVVRSDREALVHRRGRQRVEAIHDLGVAGIGEVVRSGACRPCRHRCRARGR